jgi:hypothetical protein
MKTDLLDRLLKKRNKSSKVHTDIVKKRRRKRKGE